jgi:hypothetical protein
MIPPRKAAPTSGFSTIGGIMFVLKADTVLKRDRDRYKTLLETFDNKFFLRSESVAPYVAKHMKKEFGNIMLTKFARPTPWRSTGGVAGPFVFTLSQVLTED